MSDRPPRVQSPRRNTSGAAPGSGGACDLLIEFARMKHYVLFIDRRCSVFAAQRTRNSFDELAEVAACFGEIEDILHSIPRKRYRLLVDARCGPLRNDAAFEAALNQHRGKLLFGFAKNAAIAATASGCLQIQRFARMDGRRVFATPDPAAAFDYLDIPYHHLERFAPPDGGAASEGG